MAYLVDPGTSFDTPGTPEGASIVERIFLESKQPLCDSHSSIAIFLSSANGSPFFYVVKPEQEALFWLSFQP